MKKVFLALISGLFITSIAFAEFDEGIEYIKLKKPVPTITGDKVEVRELFWYGCPHCYNLEPLVKNWLKTKPEHAEFIRQPAIFSKRWAQDAAYYYTLEELGLVDKLHELFFDAIHTKNVRFNNDEQFINWVAGFNVDAEQVKKTLKSFSTRIKVNKAAGLTNKYKIRGVPVIIVNGKFVTNSTYAGSHQNMFKVVDYLIEKERK